ncbi:uncharacterized protein METZ01_LOCUS491587, partial [marine metagenome]
MIAMRATQIPSTPWLSECLFTGLAHEYEPRRFHARTQTATVVEDCVQNPKSLLPLPLNPLGPPRPPPILDTPTFLDRVGPLEPPMLRLLGRINAASTTP